MQTSEQIDKIAGALAKAQGVLANPRKDREVKVQTKTGGSYKFKYATLDAIMDAIRAPLADNGLCYIQSVDITDNGNILLWTTIAHESGQWMKSVVPLVPSESGAQALGSAISYMKRYSLCAMIGIVADEDDDGNAADGNGREDVRTPPANNSAAKPTVHVAKNPPRQVAAETNGDDPEQHEVAECRRVQAALQAAKTAEAADLALDDPFIDYLRKAAKDPANTAQFDRLAKLDAYHQKRINIIRATPLAA